LVIAGTVGFLINETIVVIAQLNGNISNSSTTALNSTGPGKNIVVTWIESNDTKANRISMINVSSEDFWKIFELLTNKTKGTFE
jgi:hypothetical protein